MSKTYKVFIIGNSTNFDSVNIKWRNDIIQKMTKYQDNRISFVFTSDYFNKPFTEETRLWELNEIQDSDLVIVNLSNIANDISTHCMLSAIQMMNKTKPKHTFVIGIGKLDINDYWLASCIFKQFNELDEAVEYIADKFIK